MTRIIGGSAGGRRLRTPRGRGTRPTSDRVREALFSRLDALDVLAGARVLDAYAGSGALGLEAASRGASAVVCIESERAAAALIGANAQALGLPVEVRAMTVARFAASGDSPPFEVMLADPPYPLPEADLARDLAALASAGLLPAGALVVVERSSRSPQPSWPPGWSADDDRRYGETRLWFATVADAAC